MTEIKTLNNNVSLIGCVTEEPKLDHTFHGTKYYKFKIEVKRNSGISDEVVIAVSENDVNLSEMKIGTEIFVDGVYRSYNDNNGKHKLVLYVLAKKIGFDVDANDCSSNNKIYLNGFICKPPVYRKTPKGRDVADILLAVNGSYGKSEYVPCILWGNNAKIADSFGVGTNIEIWGRVQSREYTKMVDSVAEKRTAYEISVFQVAEVS